MEQPQTSWPLQRPPEPSWPTSRGSGDALAGAPIHQQQVAYHIYLSYLQVLRPGTHCCQARWTQGGLPHIKTSPSSPDNIPGGEPGGRAGGQALC